MRPSSRFPPPLDQAGSQKTRHATGGGVGFRGQREICLKGRRSLSSSCLPFSSSSASWSVGRSVALPPVRSGSAYIRAHTRVTNASGTSNSTATVFNTEKTVLNHYCDDSIIFWQRLHSALFFRPRDRPPMPVEGYCTVYSGC